MGKREVQGKGNENWEGERVNIYRKQNQLENMEEEKKTLQKENRKKEGKKREGKRVMGREKNERKRKGNKGGKLKKKRVEGIILFPIS